MGLCDGLSLQNTRALGWSCRNDVRFSLSEVRLEVVVLRVLLRGGAGHESMSQRNRNSFKVQPS